MQIIYLVLSLLGLILPYSQLIPFINNHGLDLALFWSELFSNRISTAFSFDLLVSSVVFWLLLFKEGTRLQMKLLWVYVLGNLTIGLSFALPLFLYMRSRRITEMQMPQINQELSGETM
ncbi:MAG: DUF2834 domain-containing protein [Cyanobacteria bacterium P01_E01_bin.35]